MSSVDRAIRWAADELPEPERSRYREEWSADLAAAAELGLNRAAIAAGAVGFALRSSLQEPLAAERWARWSLATASLGPVAWLVMILTGVFWYPGYQDAGFAIGVASGIVAVALGAMAWRRSETSVWSTGATVIMLCLSAVLWLIGPDQSPLMALVMTMLAAGFVSIGLGMLARRRRVGGWAIASVLVAAALPALVVLRPFASAEQGWLLLIVVPVAVILVAAHRHRRSALTDRPR